VLDRHLDLLRASAGLCGIEDGPYSAGTFYKCVEGTASCCFAGPPHTYARGALHLPGGGGGPLPHLGAEGRLRGPGLQMRRRPTKAWGRRGG
jgi:hypothetical protein